MTNIDFSVNALGSVLLSLTNRDVYLVVLKAGLSEVIAEWSIKELCSVNLRTNRIFDFSKDYIFNKFGIFFFGVTININLNRQAKEQSLFKRLHASGPRLVYISQQN
jgi:hypothetical protein